MNKPYREWPDKAKEKSRQASRRYRSEHKVYLSAYWKKRTEERTDFYSSEKAKNSEWYKEAKARACERTKRHRRKSESLGYCRICKRVPALGKRMCKKHLVSNNRRNRTQNVALKLAAFKAYGGARCSCSCGCKVSAHEVLTMDHIGGWRKYHQEKMGGVALYRWLRKNGYPKGFRVLCLNCNFAIGHFGYCPHEFETRDKSSSTVPVFENSDAISRKPALVN